MFISAQIKGIFQGKCPQCLQGFIFFPLKNTSSFFQMHKKCTNCSFVFEKEIGFFYGAMYVAYALTVILAIFYFLLIFYLYKPQSPFTYMISIPILLFLSTPFVYRWSRIFWIYFNK